MIHPRALLALALLVSLAAPASAHAQEAETSETDHRDLAARAYHERGEEAFGAGDYETALEAWERAWELSARPRLQYNMGTALDRMRRDDEALAHFERFLELEPDAPQANEVRARIEVLRVQLDSNEAEGAREEGEDEVVDDDRRVEPGAADAAGGPRVAWAWIPAGLMVGTAVAAGVLWASASSEYANLETECAIRACSGDDVSSIDGKVAATNALWVTTGVLAAIAATVLVFELTAGDDERDVSIGFGPTSIMVRGTL